MGSVEEMKSPGGEPGRILFACDTQSLLITNTETSEININLPTTLTAIHSMQTLNNAKHAQNTNSTLDTEVKTEH